MTSEREFGTAAEGGPAADDRRAPDDHPTAPGGFEALAGAEDIAALRRLLAGIAVADTEREAIDRITALEELKAACTAAQARESFAFDAIRRAAEKERGLPSESRGRGVGAEIALARKESRARGSRFLSLSRALVTEMPHTLEALTAGSASEEKAQVMAKETAWLRPEDRRRVDEEMAEDIARLGVRTLGNSTRGAAQRIDQAGAVEHLERCAEERRVSVRPAPGNMAYLTALLPMPQAVAAYANLHKTALALNLGGHTGGRNHSQVMADLCVERLTGQETAEAVPMEIHVVMDQGSLLADGEEPAWLPGHGPVPAATMRRLIADSEGRVFVRRLFTAPQTGQLVGMDSTRRSFAGLLRRMVLLRDDRCRTPWCDAAIKHIDHAAPVREGGATSYDNASGLCAACNYAKENPGWRHDSDPERLRVTTPTGHEYSVPTRPVGTARSGSDPIGTSGDPPPTGSPPGAADGHRDHVAGVENAHRGDTGRGVQARPEPPDEQAPPRENPQPRREGGRPARTARSVAELAMRMSYLEARSRSRRMDEKRKEVDQAWVRVEPLIHAASATPYAFTYRTTWPRPAEARLVPARSARTEPE